MNHTLHRTAKKATPLFKLTVYKDGARVDEVVVTHDIVTLGRGADNDLRLDDHTVSTHHMQFSYTGGRIFVEDLDSTNGTYVNGHRVKIQAVVDGDNVVLGKHRLTVHTVDEEALQVERHPPTEMLESSELDRLLGTTQRGGASVNPASGKKVLNWIAQDAKGIWWGFEHQPQPDEMGWTDTLNGIRIQLKEDDKPLPDWRESLRKI